VSPSEKEIAARTARRARGTGAEPDVAAVRGAGPIGGAYSRTPTRTRCSNASLARLEIERFGAAGTAGGGPAGGLARFLIRDTLERAAGAGLLRPAPTDVVAHLVLSALIEAALLIAHAVDRGAARAAGEEGLRLLLSGLLLPPVRDSRP
jgi:Tetracyclin repressor-like, C-terminal domain